MTTFIGSAIALSIFAVSIFVIYRVTQAMLDVAHLRGYLEARQHERRDPDSAPCVGSGE